MITIYESYDYMITNNRNFAAKFGIIFVCNSFWIFRKFLMYRIMYYIRLRENEFIIFRILYYNLYEFLI